MLRINRLTHGLGQILQPKEFVILEGAGHSIFIERFEEVHTLLVRSRGRGRGRGRGLSLMCFNNIDLLFLLTLRSLIVQLYARYDGELHYGQEQAMAMSSNNNHIDNNTSASKQAHGSTPST
jgi:hypothetical protein